MSGPFPAAWIDGRVVALAEARVPVTDRGFLLGDSIFETLVALDRVPFLLGDHIDRLRDGAARVGIAVPWTDSDLEQAVAALLPGGRDAVIRIVVTRGDGGPGLGFAEDDPPRLVVLARERPATAGRPVRLATHHGLRESAVPPEIKAGSRLGDVLRWREAARAGADEVLVRGPDGWAEGSTTNLFVVRNGVVRTPGTDAGILPGTTRAVVIAALRADGIRVEEAAVDDPALFLAEEIFLTSTLRDVAPVLVLDGVLRPTDGPVTDRAGTLFRQWRDGILAGRVGRLAAFH